ncbi:hypothetical protein Efla_007632 [Eimeria flavescens]
MELAEGSFAGCGWLALEPHLGVDMFVEGRLLERQCCFSHMWQMLVSEPEWIIEGSPLERFQLCDSHVAVTPWALVVRLSEECLTAFQHSSERW